MNKEEINKRFDERFPDYCEVGEYDDSTHEHCDTDWEAIKDFIHQEIERAVAEKDEEFTEMISNITNSIGQVRQAVSQPTKTAKDI